MTRSVLLGCCTMFVIITSPLAAQGGRQRVTKGSQTRGGAGAGVVCSYLTEDEVKPVLGSELQPTFSTAGHCTWAAKSGGKQIVLITMRTAGEAAEHAFDYALANPIKGADKGVVQSGFGDKSFAMMLDRGVQIDVLKNKKMMQVQYLTGAHGTAADLEKLKPIATKAIAAY
ncbi:MAG: hypothetical protein ABJB66_02180 [Gemmatimonadaceae bacterium]